MKRPLWRRLADLFALALCALLAVGFALGAVFTGEGFGDRVWKAVIAILLASTFVKAARPMLKDWRTTADVA